MRKTVICTVGLIVLGLGTGNAKDLKVTRGLVDMVCGKGVNACSKCLPKCFDYQCKGSNCKMVPAERTVPQPPRTGIAPPPTGAK